MNKIVALKDVSAQVKEDKKKGYKIILAGGCFDILHIGHIKFLEKAKALGGKLYILLESDKKVRLLKGEKRPVFKQRERAQALSSVKDADLIITLPYFTDDLAYRKLVGEIEPDIIAVTENDTKMEKKRLQADRIGAILMIIPYVQSLSSSKIAAILSTEEL